jgi:hypothetical protein
MKRGLVAAFAAATFLLAAPSPHIGEMKPTFFQTIHRYNVPAPKPGNVTWVNHPDGRCHEDDPCWCQIRSNQCPPVDPTSDPQVP